MSGQDDPDIALTGRPRYRLPDSARRLYGLSGRREWTKQEDEFLMDPPAKYRHAEGRKQAGKPDMRAIADLLGVSVQTAKIRRSALLKAKRDAES